MRRRHQIISEQRQNGDLHEDEALLVDDELFKYEWYQEIALPASEVVVNDMRAQNLPPQPEEELDAEAEDVVPVIVDAQRASDVAGLLALADRMGRTVADRGLTEEKLAELLDGR